MCRAGVGMPEAMRHIGLTDDSPPRLREDGRVRFVTPRHAGKDVIALALNSLQYGLGSQWEGSDRGARFRVTEPQAGIRQIDFRPFEVQDFRAATPDEGDQSNCRDRLPMLAVEFRGLKR